MKASDLTSEFVREYIDAHVDEVSSKLTGLPAVYRHFGMPDSSAYSLHTVTKELARRISDCFQTGHRTARRLLKHIQDDLIYDQVLDEKRIDPYFTVLDHLSDALMQGANAKPLTIDQPVDGDWHMALGLACDSLLVHDWTSPSLRERVRGRTYHVARAAMRLRSLGITVTRSQHAVGLEESSDLKIAGIIEDKVRRFGGVNVARRLFQQITPLYQPQQERYQLVRHVDMTGAARPHIPFGYIALLAEKHATSQAVATLTTQDWSFICQVVTDYAAILDVQPYTLAFSTHISPTLLPRHLQEVAIFDSIFTLPQFRPSDLPDLIAGMLDGLDLDAKRDGTWSLREAMDVIRLLLDLSVGKRGPVIIDRRQLGRILPNLPQATLIAILDDVLSHAHCDVNPNYSRPLDGQSASTFSRRPLIKQGGRRYVLLDRSLCAPNCLEALFTPLRASIKNFDTVQVGPAIERFLATKLQHAGITPRSGSYAVGHQIRECDLVVETTEIVIFIEVKKKPLTFRARFGSDANLLIDLGGSVVDALVQSGWHEHELRKQGYLDLIKDGSTYRIELGSRKIERIAVSLLDFGGFQDRVFVDSFLNGIRTAKFHSRDNSLTARFTAFNNSIDILNQQVSMLAGLGVDVERPFFHCWFLSIPQLLVLLDDVSNAEEFKKSLWVTRHIHSGVSDFYYEHAYMKQLKAKAGAEAS